MPTVTADQTACLITSIHQPQRSTVQDCLLTWLARHSEQRSGCYMVVHGDGVGHRRTLNADQIADLAAGFGLFSRQHAA